MQNSVLQNDEILWADFVSGSDEAFRIIYNSYVQNLFRYGCHFTSDEGLVQDCIHDLFLDLHFYRSRLGTNDNIKLYLFVSLRRKIIKKLDRLKKVKSLSIDDTPFDYLLVPDESDSEDDKKKLEYLKKALEKVSPKQREAVYLKFVSGLNYDELCKVLGVNYQVARNLVYRGLEKLRENCSKSALFLLLSLVDKKYSKKI